MTKTLHDHRAGSTSEVITVLHVGNLQWGSEKAVVESFLRRLAGRAGRGQPGGSDCHSDV